ncbi:ABC-type phosphate transport system, substrate-binding protein [Cryobacterium flavum]|uniref:ABC-type phosphate transport system, substrate-binding protein n=1 Tax=Cryobacterium flavum TaxID=1424659 RepID=A0A4R8VIN0_9MICO|nr:substrate-binding domain-containing protein [Cryobacterium flavum]TFB82382.1 phosphate ABC transporter substrate-binding protein [Cryobacterium flavum]SDO49684.1 ABC-type phosphate transport system, substrate-binding protein [Cryobacterium flavum]
MSLQRIPRWGVARVTVALLGLALIASGVFGAAGALPAYAVGTVHSPIVGSGSTWSANALQAWIRNVWANYQWKITYSESGSTQGRNDFANGTSDFGVSEIPYAIANSNEADIRPSREFAYMPIVAGGTAFMYNLEIGGKRVTNLRLSGDTIAKIFTGVITRWDDPQVKVDNPALVLPSIPIVPVVRSDGSGATAQVSIWLRQEHAGLWDAYCPKVGRPLVNDHCGVTSNYPVIPGSGFVARSGSNGVAGYVALPHAVGAITFVEYSYALNSGYPVAKVLNGAGYYTEPTAQNVAVGLLSAQINEDTASPEYLTQDLTNVYTSADPRTYSLSSYSYSILPTALGGSFTENKGLTLADFGAYFLCEGQQSAEVLGYSPLPINLVQAGQKQLQKVPGGNPVIKGITDCNNPTFSPDGSNKLANEAPYPADCDKQGPTQCTTGTGGAKDTPTGAGAATGPGAATAAGDETGAGGGPAAGDGQQASGSEGVLDAETAPVIVAASPQSIPVAAVSLLPSLAMAGFGGGLFAFSAIPPILGKRGRTSLLPDPADGIADTSRGLTRS